MAKCSAVRTAGLNCVFHSEIVLIHQIHFYKTIRFSVLIFINNHILTTFRFFSGFFFVNDLFIKGHIFFLLDLFNFFLSQINNLGNSFHTRLYQIYLEKYYLLHYIVCNCMYMYVFMCVCVSI